MPPRLVTEACADESITPRPPLAQVSRLPPPPHDSARRRRPSLTAGRHASPNLARGADGRLPCSPRAQAVTPSRPTPAPCPGLRPGSGGKAPAGPIRPRRRRRSSAARGLPVKDARGRRRLRSALLQARRTVSCLPEQRPRPPPLPPSETTPAPPSPVATGPPAPGPAPAAGNRRLGPDPPARRHRPGRGGAEGPEAATGGWEVSESAGPSPPDPPQPPAPCRPLRRCTEPALTASPAPRHFNSRAPSRLLPLRLARGTLLPPAACWDM